MKREPLQLKVCGMRNAKNIADVGALKPDYMGFIFYRPSPRYVGEDFSLPENFPSTIRKVGVFVNEAPDSILSKVRNLQLDFVQLHGNEPAGLCEVLKQQDMKIIKVFSIGDVFDFKVTKPYESVVDYFLFDTKGKNYGGNAQVFKWEILKQYDQQVPFFLSGGLTVENIAGVKRLRGMNLHGLDVNSGVELEPGLKSPELISGLKSKMNVL